MNTSDLQNLKAETIDDSEIGLLWSSISLYFCS